MAKIHTHYDNLRVAHNAPVEVIRAAYKTLSQKFHPDRHAGNAEAGRIMAILNASYDVLSNPEKRAAHDQWIAEQESKAGGSNESSTPPHTPTPSASAGQRGGSLGVNVNVVSHLVRHWFWYALAGFFVWISVFDKPSAPPPGPKPYQASAPYQSSPPYQASAPSQPSRPTYVRPAVAPNGHQWPVTAAYVSGYPRLHTGGLSSVTVDNSRNDSDVFVKLVSLDAADAYPVRSLFIPAYGSFTLDEVNSGSYDVRYRDLESGALSRSESFTLEEIATHDGTEFSNVTMTLYKVRNGNMKTYGLSETEF